MAKLRIGFLGLSALLSFSLGCGIALAGNSSGGGGHVIVCETKDKITTQLYDFWEGAALGMAADFAGVTGLREKVELAMQRIEKQDPERAARYRANVTHFFQNYVLVDQELTFISDAGESFLQPECEMKQLAIRRINPLVGEPDFMISKHHWDRLDETNRAGLILHEVIYKEAFEVNNHPNSQYARYFNQLVSSNRISGLSAGQYQQSLEQGLLANSKDTFAQIDHSTGIVFNYPGLKRGMSELRAYCDSIGFPDAWWWLRLNLSRTVASRSFEAGALFWDGANSAPSQWAVPWDAGAKAFDTAQEEVFHGPDSHSPAGADMPVYFFCFKKIKGKTF